MTCFWSRASSTWMVYHGAYSRSTSGGREGGVEWAWSSQALQVLMAYATALGCSALAPSRIAGGSLPSVI